MYIASRYMNAVDELQAEMQHIAWKTNHIRKTIDQDDIFRGDWTSNDTALALDDLREDLAEFGHYVDLAIEELAGIIEREEGRK